MGMAMLDRTIIMSPPHVWGNTNYLYTYRTKTAVAEGSLEFLII